jgi:hypothetical protein
LILAFIITAGTITAFYPSSSSFMTDVQAVSDVEKDDISCTNLNANVNGLNFTALPEPLRNLLDSQSQTEDSDNTNYITKNNEKGSENNRDFVFICKNFNENVVPIPSSTPQPTPTPLNNNVYVVWEEEISGDFNIFFSASYDNGQTFSFPINISKTPDGNSSLSPQISTEGNNVYVVWQEEFPSTTEVFFVMSNDKGQTFSLPKSISESTGSSVSPQISTKENQVYVVWEDLSNFPNSEIFFTASNDNGNTFSDPVNLSENTGSSAEPHISTEGNNVYILWLDSTSGSSEFFFRVSNDNGNTFSILDSLSDNGINGVDPRISSEGNNVYIVWRVPASGGFDVFFTVSNDNGNTFSDPVNLSNSASTNFPQISSEGNNVYVVWTESQIPSFNLEIFFTVSNDNGNTFSDPVNLSENSGSSFVPQISSERDHVYVVWQDDTLGTEKVFFRSSDNNGETFGPIDVLGNNNRDSETPRISSNIS